MSSVQPFNLRVPDVQLEDLRRRLATARWPECETVSDTAQGAPLEFVQDICAYWANGYDWRRCEAMLNGFGQFTTEIDGLSIHFLHIRSPHPDAMPLVMTHGWPGSVIEFHKVIGPLTDPTAHGGKAEDAFHLVLPSLPGYGFSGKPTTAGWNIVRIARAWGELMHRLGYTEFLAQGGDWGAIVTDSIASQAVAGCRGVHMNMVFAAPDMSDEPTAREAEAIAAMQEFQDLGSGYQKLQSTRPQTIGYGLADSPVGQAAWILEKLSAWSDSGGDARTVLSKDEMIDNVMLYWLTNSGASSARLYWETAQPRGMALGAITLPVACTIFPKELMRPVRKSAALRMSNIVYWNEVTRGGHFAAFEQPELFVQEVRAGLALMR
jgi:pimeloyl-ACP methyl ester carboxylesterase